jgi:uncharacterized protein (DUF1501 family)
LRQALVPRSARSRCGATIRDLRFINTAAAHGSSLTDYKALVCIFLSGGNDANNW